VNDAICPTPARTGELEFKESLAGKGSCSFLTMCGMKSSTGGNVAYQALPKLLLCSSIGGSGSIIVVTIRTNKWPEATWTGLYNSTLSTQELPCLTEDDSRKLFSKKAFNKGVQEQA